MPESPDPIALEALPPAAKRSRRVAASRGALRPGGEPEPLLRKPVNTLAIVPKSHKITSLGRKSYNVLLHEAQEQGLDKTVFQAPLERIIRGVDFDSNDQALIKKHLRSMVSTTVEWQSPTTGEGASWNVSGLLAHARLSKVRGQVWVEWSYAVNLKQELLEPTVFARLSLEIISQLRSHAGIALYEICSRYKDIGRTSRQAWAWWRPVLSGRPETERTAKLEYRIFKRDTLKPAIAEVNAVTDLDIELLEHKAGRFIDELQFLIRRKPQASLPLRAPAEPVDLSLITRAQSLGIDDTRAEELADAYGAAALRSGLDALERRLATAFPEPLRDPYRYLKALMPGEALRAGQGGGTLAAPALLAAESAVSPWPASGLEDPPPRTSTPAAPSPEQQRRQAHWAAAWLRQRQAQLTHDIASMSADEQARLCELLAEDLQQRQVHPSIRKRLQVSGWQHPMVLHEMLRLYGRAAIGEHWDQPTPQDLLAVATALGDGDTSAPTRFS